MKIDFTKSTNTLNSTEPFPTSDITFPSRCWNSLFLLPNSDNSSISSHLPCLWQSLPCTVPQLYARICNHFSGPTSLSLFPFPFPTQFLSTSVCYDRPTFLGSLGRVSPQQFLQARLCPLCAVLQQSPARGLCRPASLHRPSCWQHSRGTEPSFAKRPKTSLAVVASSPVCNVAPADFEE